LGFFALRKKEPHFSPVSTLFSRHGFLPLKGAFYAAARMPKGFPLPIFFKGCLTAHKRAVYSPLKSLLKNKT
jgi:hypothetical protein